MEEDKKKKKIKLIFRIVITVLVLAALILIPYLVMRAFGYDSISREQLQGLIEKAGVWGPIVFIIISFLQVTFIPVPSTLTILVGSYLFGPYLSFLYSYIGIILGSLFAFFLGRKIGKPFINWVVGDKETVDSYLKRMKGKEKVVLFFMFLFPFFPDDAICAIAGILPISYLSFIIMQLITRATSIAGNLLFLSGEFIPYEGWGISVLIVLGIFAIVAFIYCFKNAEKINDWFDSFTSKIFKKNKDKK